MSRYLVKIYRDQDRSLNIMVDDYSIKRDTADMKLFIFLYRDGNIIGIFDLGQTIGFLAMEEENE